MMVGSSLVAVIPNLLLDESLANYLADLTGQPIDATAKANQHGHGRVPAGRRGITHGPGGHN
jgi:hypothetical protein